MRVVNRRLGGCIEYLAGRLSRVTSLEMRKLIRTRHKFYHSLGPLLPFPIFPSSSWQWFLSPSFSGGLFGRPLLNLRPINQTIPYKFVTREIARILGARGASFLSPSDSYPGIPRGNLSLRAFPTLSLFSARVYRRFRAHFYLSRK